MPNFPVIGIDLGTTNSCVGWWDNANGSVEILANEQGKNTTPSHVGFSADGKIVIGEKAKAVDGVFVYDAKRIIGKQFSSEQVQSHLANWTFPVAGDEDGRCFIMRPDGKKERIEQVSSRVLAGMRVIAEKKLQQKVRHAVITVPAYFNDNQKTATKIAAKAAGLKVLRMINEPTAAAMAANIHEEDDEKNIIVFDFGGGTFDISVLTISEGLIDVQATKGDMNLGGRDLDEALVIHCLKKFQEEHGVDMSGDKQARGRLEAECERAKISLSVDFGTRLLLRQFSDGKDLDVAVTRSEFEELIDPTLSKLMPLLFEAMDDASMSADEIDQVLLVGGSTRIPKVHDLLEEHFGMSPNSDVNADEGVAHGATVMAGILAASIEDDQDSEGEGDNQEQQQQQSSHQTQSQRQVPTLIVSDVTPLSLGIKCAGDIMDKVIARNCNIPLDKTKNYTTTRENQEKLVFDVRQGENDTASLNHSLGRFTITNLPSGAAGSVNIEVTFRINKDGILTVKGKSTHNGREEAITIQRQEHHTLSPEIIASMIEEGRFTRAQNMVSFGDV